MFAKTFTPLLLVTLLIGCQSSPEEIATVIDYAGFDTFGDVSKHASVSTDVVTSSRLVSDVSKLEGKTVTVSGTVREVCQAAGCWLTLDTAEGADAATIRIAVARDEDGEYEFTVPKDISGRKVFVTGMVEEQEVDVETQEHYAEDAAKAKAAMEASEDHASDSEHDADGDGDNEHASGDTDESHDGDDDREELEPVTEIRITAVGVSVAPAVTAAP